jgi:hypothetical protein
MPMYSYLKYVISISYGIPIIRVLHLVSERFEPSGPWELQ